MFKSHDYEEQYVERENDFANIESNSYLACVYAQLSLSRSANDGSFAPVAEFDC